MSANPDNPDKLDKPDTPLTPALHVRRAIDLKVTVVGRQLEDRIIDLVESGEDIILGNESVSLAVTDVSRDDGLPLGVEKMFESWFQLSGLRDSLKDTAKMAYLSGMREGGVGTINHNGDRAR